MDQFSHDLTIALEETSLLDRVRVSRWGQQRRRTRSTGNLPCAPQPTEDSSSPTELMFNHRCEQQTQATNSYDGLDTHNVCLPSDTDDDDKEDEVVLQRLSCFRPTMNVAAIRLGTLESDSLNENFSPSRFFKPAARRKRKLKRISMYCDITSNSTITSALVPQISREPTNTPASNDVVSTVQSSITTATTPTTVTTTIAVSSATPMEHVTLRSKDINLNTESSTPIIYPSASTNCLGTLRKRGMKPDPIFMPGAVGCNGSRTQLFFCGKRKRSNRERCHQEHHPDHSFSMPRYYSYMEEYRMRPRSFSSTSKSPCEKLLPLNKGLLSKIERIAQQHQQEQQQQQQQKKEEPVMDGKEQEAPCRGDSDTSEEGGNDRKCIGEGNDGEQGAKLTLSDAMKSVDNTDLEMDTDFGKPSEMSNEEKGECGGSQKEAPREQKKKTEGNPMTATDEKSIGNMGIRKSSNGLCSSSEKQLHQPTLLPNSFEKFHILSKLRFPSFQQQLQHCPHRNHFIDNQYGTHRIYRKKRYNDPNSNFYCAMMENVERNASMQQQQRQQRKGFGTVGNFDSMDCEDLNGLNSSSSLSSSESEDGRPTANDTDREGDDELTDCPGNENVCGEGSGKYGMKRKLLKRSTLPQIKSDPESLSAILTGEDDTIMSDSSTMGSGGVGGTTATTNMQSNNNTATATSEKNQSFSTHSSMEQYVPSFPSSQPITIAQKSTAARLGIGFGGSSFPENNGLHGKTLNRDSDSFMMSVQLPPPLSFSQVSTAVSGNTSSCTSTTPIEIREIRAGCRRVRIERPGFSVKTSINEQLARFLQNPQQLQLHLPDIEIYEHESLANLANMYSLQLSLENGCAVLNKTSNTTQSVAISQQKSLGGHLLLNDCKRRCYDSKDTELFQK